MNYFICGFSGCGKSYLLQKLKTEALFKGYDFIDLDDYIFEKYAASYKSLGDFIRAEGFERFRSLELESIQEITMKPQYILALGGGSLSEKSMQALEKIKGFWLNTKFEQCYERIKDDSNRPLSVKSKDELYELYQARTKNYEKYSSIGDVEDLLKLVKEFKEMS